MSFKTIELTSWNDIHKYAAPEWPTGWLFRGQRSSGRDLETSLERCCDRQGIAPDKRRDVEERLFREFRRTYHHYSQHIPERKCVVEWLSLMQHHGAPTRLLDFSYSVYVAAYFATEKAEGDCAIWAVDGPWALGRAESLLRSGGKRDEDVKRMMEPFQEGDEEVVTPLFFDKPHIRAAWPINAFRLNERLRIQQGAFLIPGDVSQSFMANLAALMLGSDAEDRFLKIIIPQAEARLAVRRLYSMDISRTSLFPGLDGYAHSLGVWNPAFDPINWKRTV